MTLRKVETRAVPLRSKEYKDLICVKEWTKHTIMQDDPLEGVPAHEQEVFLLAEGRKIASCQEIVVRGVYSVRTDKGGVWYETPVERLEELRRKRKEKLKKYTD